MCFHAQSDATFECLRSSLAAMVDGVAAAAEAHDRLDILIDACSLDFHPEGQRNVSGHTDSTHACGVSVSFGVQTEPTLANMVLLDRCQMARVMALCGAGKDPGQAYDAAVAACAHGPDGFSSIDPAGAASKGASDDPSIRARVAGGW